MNNEHIFYNLENFENLYISVALTFDNYFNDKNNKLINSDEHYLSYKSDYITSTNESYIIFSNLINEFDSLNNNFIKNDKKKYIYNFIDKDQHNIINNKLKNLLEIQRKKLETFLNYIEFLNCDKVNINNPTMKPDSRMTKLSSKNRNLK